MTGQKCMDTRPPQKAIDDSGSDDLARFTPTSNR